MRINDRWRICFRWRSGHAHDVEIVDYHRPVHEQRTMSEPLELITPGEILREEFMRPHAISQNRLSRDIDVPLVRINEIVNDRRAITADTALRLAKYFGTSAELWLGLQMEYDIRRVRRDVWPAIAPRIRSLTTA